MTGRERPELHSFAGFSGAGFPNRLSCNLRSFTVSREQQFVHHPSTCEALTPCRGELSCSECPLPASCTQTSPSDSLFCSSLNRPADKSNNCHISVSCLWNNRSQSNVITRAAHAFSRNRSKLRASCHNPDFPSHFQGLVPVVCLCACCKDLTASVLF